MLKVIGEDILAYQEKLRNRDKELSIWEKEILTVEEAAVYSGVGIIKLRKLVMQKNCSFCMSDGKRMWIVRKKFDAFMDKQGEI